MSLSKEAEANVPPVGLNLAARTSPCACVCEHANIAQFNAVHVRDGSSAREV